MLRGHEIEHGHEDGTDTWAPDEPTGNVLPGWLWQFFQMHPASVMATLESVPGEIVSNMIAVRVDETGVEGMLGTSRAVRAATLDCRMDAHGVRPITITVVPTAQSSALRGGRELASFDSGALRVRREAVLATEGVSSAQRSVRRVHGRLSDNDVS